MDFSEESHLRHFPFLGAESGLGGHAASALTPRCCVVAG